MAHLFDDFLGSLKHAFAYKGNPEVDDALASLMRVGLAASNFTEAQKGQLNALMDSTQGQIHIETDDVRAFVLENIHALEKWMAVLFNNETWEITNRSKNFRMDDRYTFAVNVAKFDALLHLQISKDTFEKIDMGLAQKTLREFYWNTATIIPVFSKDSVFLYVTLERDLLGEKLAKKWLLEVIQQIPSDTKMSFIDPVNVFFINTVAHDNTYVESYSIDFSLISQHEAFAMSPIFLAIVTTHMWLNLANEFKNKETLKSPKVWMNLKTPWNTACIPQTYKDGASSLYAFPQIDYSKRDEHKRLNDHNAKKERLVAKYIHDNNITTA